jgi:cytochrome P450
MIDAFLPRGQCDLMPDVAFPLPIRVIADMLGLPPEDHERIKELSEGMLPSLTPALSSQQAGAVNKNVVEFQEYVRSHVELRRKAPRDDLLSAMVAATEQGDRLSEPELIATCILLAFAGHATTVQLIANTIAQLLQNPDQLQLLRSDPGLLEATIEEALRWSSPIQVIYRTALDDVTLGGKTIPRGQMLFVSLAAANHDPEMFTDPDRFDIRRPNNSKHLAFGNHIHYCAGAPLARLEGQIAVETLLRRLPNLRFAGKVERETSLVLRGIKSLPLTFG